MHTYRRVEGLGWQAGYQHPAEERFNPLGPIVEEHEAAALVSFLNGGRYSPGEIEQIYASDPAPEDADDDDVHPARPQSLEDYPVDRRKS